MFDAFKSPEHLNVRNKLFIFIRNQIPILFMGKKWKFKKILLISAVCITAYIIIIFGIYNFNANDPFTKIFRKTISGNTENNSFVIPSLDIKMVKINPGSLIDRNKNKRIFITNIFYISSHEITVGEYKNFPLPFHEKINSNEENKPVTNISWHDAVKFCKLLTAREKESGKLPTGYEYRLPTEAEWEYAAGGGTDGLYYHGTIPERLPLYAVYNTGAATEIMTKKPNSNGLYDTLGNVWEWCYDAKGSNSFFSRINPVNKGKEYDDRAIRGGSAMTNSSNTTLAAQKYISPYTLNNMIGFRIVLAKSL